MRVLGVDPGATVTGWGVVEGQGSRFSYRGSGLIKPGAGTHPARLAAIYKGICRVVAEWQPGVVCIEESFVARNAQSALRLGEVRGVIALAAELSDLPVEEYSPAEVKVAVTGYGRADKAQVQCMVAKLLNLPEIAEADRADALAAALCCLQRIPLARLVANIGGEGRVKPRMAKTRKRWR